MPTPQFRYFILTIKSSSWDLANVCDGNELCEEIAYITGQVEIGQSGFRHWQIYLVTKKPASVVRVKAIMKCPTAHVEPTRSKAAEGYCLKDETAVPGTRFEKGVKPFKRNSKVDWAKQLDAAKTGRDEDIDPGVLIRNLSAIRRIQAENMTKPEDLLNVCGFWIYGDPGVGKSRLARDCYPGLFPKACNKWFDGYKCGPVLLDDFDKNHKVLGHYLKIWSDRYSFAAEVKGGVKMIRPPKIIVTSNYSIDDIFGEDQTLVGALKRRFEVLHMLNKQLQ